MMRPASCLKPFIFKSVASRCLKLQTRNAYIVLLPEIPDDTPQTNALLRTESNPNFKEITLENCISGVGKSVLDFECNFEEFATKLKDAKVKKSFDTIIEPIEKISAPLNYVWSTAKLLYLVKYSTEMNSSYRNLQQRVQKARTQRFSSLPIFHAMKELQADESRLNECQRRAVEKYLLESRLNGIELSANGEVHLKNILQKLSTEKETFRNKVDQATSNFFMTVSDENLTKNFPRSLLQRMSLNRTNPSKGPWQLSLQPHIYNEFMKYCDNSDLRWNTWIANVSRASNFNDTALNTSVNIEEIRYQRREEAKLLGYKSFAEMSMETKMAGSVETVMSMITTLHKWSKPRAIEELKALGEFAKENGENGEINIWDVPYWRQRQLQSTYNLNEDEIKHYFPLSKTLENLFKICHRLFGIHIKEAKNKVQTWHDSVAYYEVFDEDDTFLGSLYFDAYARPTEKLANVAWIECGINRNDAAGTKPIAHLIMNLHPPIGEIPCLMSFDDVKVLFQKFGHCLQHLLTTVPYSEVSGLTNIEWDAVDICPQFMTNILYNAQLLHTISGHHKTGAPLPNSIIEKLRGARRHLAAFDIVHQTYLSALDLHLYSSDAFWTDVMKNVWEKYMIFPLHKKNHHPCSFTTIFCDDLPAAYYSHKWAEMVAADVYEAFAEVEHDFTELEATGRRFRKTFLASGGGCHPNLVFRQFRGRDPSPEALLKTLGLK